MRPIDADELIKIATHPGAHDYVSSWEIADAPTLDVAPIVRCKECIHRMEYECPMYYVEEIPWDDDGYTEWDYVVHDNTCDEGFCHKGERDLNLE